jgi:hypothetical protein
LYIGYTVSLTERSSVLYADLGGVCLDGLAQRLCLWGYTRSSHNIRIQRVLYELRITSVPKIIFNGLKL